MPGRASPASRDCIHPFERRLRLCDPEVATANSPCELTVSSSSKEKPTGTKAVTVATPLFSTSQFPNPYLPLILSQHASQIPVSDSVNLLVSSMMDAFSLTEIGLPHGPPFG